MERPVVLRDENGGSYFWIDDLVKLKGVGDNWSYDVCRPEYERLADYITVLETLLLLVGKGHPNIEALGLKEVRP